MDYLGKKCPICSSNFHDDDDIVVCPECGAPYHRSCYEQTGKCIFQNLHSPDKDWRDFITDDEDETEPESEQQNIGVKVCPFCGFKNEQDNISCENCGRPLFNIDPNAAGENGQPPFQNVNGIPIIIDVMGGVKPDDDFDGVKGSELAKYVKANMLYYMPIFKRIKTQNKSRFNFAAFLFGGGWMLYRKRYGLGVFVTLIMLVLTLAESFFMLFYSSDILNGVIDTLNKTYSSWGFQTFYSELSKLPDSQFYLAIAPYILSFIDFVIMLIVGFTANRGYYNYAIKKIKLIKYGDSTSHEQNTSTDEAVKAEADTAAVQNTEVLEKIEHRGGVSYPLAVSLLICDFLVSFLPQLFIQ